MSVRVGVIGTGWVSGMHLAALKKIPEAQIVAIAGRNIARTQELARACEAKAYTDYHAMLAEEKLDAAMILLPPDAHGEVEKACAQCVPAVLVEKPVANNLILAQEVHAAFEKSKTLVSVGYMNRYRQSVRLARELFSRAADKPVLVNGWWVSQMPPVAWWMDSSRSGGQFIEQCTHLVDLARYLVGEIVEVKAFSARGFVKGVQGYDADDAMTVSVKFASGAVGSFATGCFPLNGTDSQRGISLTIASRTLKCEFSGWGMQLEATHNKSRVECVKPEEDIFETQDRAFLSAIINNDPSLILSTYADAMRTLAIGCAAKESLKTVGTGLKSLGIASPL